LGGLPYLQIANIAINSPLINLSAIIGAKGIDFFVALFSALLLSFIKATKKQMLNLTLLSVFLIFLSIIFSYVDFNQKQREITAVLMNGKINQQEKQNKDKTKQTIDRYIKSSKEENDADLIIWPESSIPNHFYTHYKQTFKPLLQEKLLQNVILGTYLTQITEGLTKTNTLISLADLQQRYDKKHLAPFGEYMPKIVNVVMSSDTSDDLEEGSSNQTPIHLNNAIMSPLICFEVLFARLARDNSEKTNILIAISDFSWFLNNKNIVNVFNKASRYRAAENQKYFLRSDNFGNSTIINEKGKIIKQAYKKDYIKGRVYLFTGQTLYAIYGDIPLFIISIFFVIVGFSSARRVRPYFGKELDK
jgi:apolipoprotein N-acyltransferase